ncbi:hypothetical protein ANCDUO_02967 [Ancylostoma duodenale]|uniref:Uncharacterized protein n=1 Tax=Ancylostoma duodenale TaxID=51022 RepID=A0A0C2GYX2_9BILA|nr:hypothetical protein ANCDUO_02967 [Ancylostoma duodenale]
MPIARTANLAIFTRLVPRTKVVYIGKRAKCLMPIAKNQYRLPIDVVDIDIGVSAGGGVSAQVTAERPAASSHDMEERSSLALMAARHTASTEEEQASGNDDGRQSNRQLSYIEAYTKSIQAVESMLKLDRLRQEVAITNMLSRRERHQRLSHLGLPSQSFRMKRAVSLPNAISLVSESL